MIEWTYSDVIKMTFSASLCTAPYTLAELITTQCSSPYKRQQCEFPHKCRMVFSRYRKHEYSLSSLSDQKPTIRSVHLQSRSTSCPYLKTVIPLIFRNSGRRLYFHYKNVLRLEKAHLVIKTWMRHFEIQFCLLYTSPSPRDRQKSRMPSSA